MQTCRPETWPLTSAWSYADHIQVYCWRLCAWIKPTDSSDFADSSERGGGWPAQGQGSTIGQLYTLPGCSLIGKYAKKNPISIDIICLLWEQRRLEERPIPSVHKLFLFFLMPASLSLITVAQLRTLIFPQTGTWTLSWLVTPPGTTSHPEEAAEPAEGSCSGCAPLGWLPGRPDPDIL